MHRLILIETSTALCSTALVEDGEVTARRESTSPRAHASMTAPFVEQMLSERGLKVRDCDAVCVSKGPGSYTGLRVGVSTAKGLCFGAGLPLLAVSSLEVLVAKAIATGKVPADCSAIIPVIDARRMEVYSAVFSPDGVQSGEIEPVVITEDSFREQRSKGRILLIGDGAAKCSEMLPDAAIEQTCPDAASMLAPALREFEGGHYENTAYFEPFYLKDFVATVSRKKLF
ncbi:MAG: tRNA (adenosine(37)-N6)-threonylcarbamoyltransferase complex dimerization subunit type 1 TsaB [Candidatus Cryptobacteroides sp.]|nr:tRNA (adenosine(37)-N6)-threonylcarbamoyltransferase complex dimerization subunit type 1 TsaB [Candidatus Cryptobacteroides sp.]